MAGPAFQDELRYCLDMLTSIQAPGAKTGNQEDAITLLLGCHGRIRHFTEVALRLAGSANASAGELSSAAQGVLRYYTIALPLHEADENDSIYPRLHKLLPPGHLAEANEAMVEQHKGIDALIAQLVPMWRQVEAGEGTAAAFRKELLERTSALQNLWQSHLQLEEEQVVPAMREFLRPADLREIEGEMRARREPAR